MFVHVTVVALIATVNTSNATVIPAQSIVRVMRLTAFTLEFATTTVTMTVSLAVFRHVVNVVMTIIALNTVMCLLNRLDMITVAVPEKANPGGACNADLLNLHAAATMDVIFTFALSGLSSRPT